MKRQFEIAVCVADDLPEILDLYQAARKLQTEHQMVVWPEFSEQLVNTEIREKRQFKIVIDGEIACNWAVTLSDPDIWEQKDQGDAIYIHRFCSSPKHRGKRFVNHMVSWAKAYAQEEGRIFVRLDTLGQNHGLVKHYTSAGFTFLGVFQLSKTSSLPQHYQDEKDCLLFELEV